VSDAKVRDGGMGVVCAVDSRERKKALTGDAGRTACQCDASAMLRLRSMALAGAKRTGDVVLSLHVILLCLPLGALVSIAIVLDSIGPAILCQERSGRNRSRFRMCEFRSTVASAGHLREGRCGRPWANGPVFKRSADPRVIRVGRLLRRSSLGELPQFAKVLLVQRGLVGPRPLPAADLDNCRDLPEGVTRPMVEVCLARRQRVRPGGTCRSQVNGGTVCRWSDGYGTIPSPLRNRASRSTAPWC
jgi:lipopolysaccharide/colanic/teichoic acid biosynthesis glycosyltransferase